MFKANILQSITKENINISLLKNEIPNFEKNIEIDHRSDEYPNNVVPGRGESVATFPDSLGFLNIDNTNRDILVTYETKFKNNEFYPLWFTHRTLKFMYNKSLEFRSSTRYVTIENPSITNLFPEGSNAVMVRGSVQIQLKGTSGRDLVNSEFAINYSEGEIHIISESAINAADNFLVSYYILTPDVVMTTNNNTIDEKHYRVEIEFAYGSEQEQMPTASKTRYTFICRVLTDLLNTDDNLYKIEYQSWNPSGTNKETEILKSYPIYSSSNNIVLGEREFNADVDTGKIKVASTSSLDTYFVKNNLKFNEKISTDSINRDGKELWYLQISPQSIEYNSNTYNILEKSKYQFFDDVYRLVKKTNEKAIALDKTILKLKNNDLVVRTDVNGNVLNITININGDDISNSNISDFDKDVGLIILSQNVAPKDIIKVTYEYRTKMIPYDHLQLNPSYQFQSSNDDRIILKNYIVFVLPEDILNSEYNRSIFHYSVEKYPSLFFGIPSNELFIEDALDYLSGTNDETGRSNIYDFIDNKYFSSLDESSIIPMILCYAIAINTSVSSSIKNTDTRIRGGGVTETVSNEELILVDPSVQYNADICYLDGRPYPSNNVYVVRIPSTYKDTIANKLRLYDKELTRYKRKVSNDLFEAEVEKRAKDFIEEATKRFLPASAHIIIEYIQGAL